MSEDKQRYQARIELVGDLAYHCAHGDEETSMQTALKLWELTDEQLAQFAWYILMGTSPLRDMSRVRSNVDWSTVVRG